MNSNSTVAIMQPYFLPYIGYFQLIQSSSVFVIFDDVQFRNRSWMNRNRFLEGDKVVYYTLPVKTHKQKTKIRDIDLSQQHSIAVEEIRNRFEHNYSAAPYFSEAQELLKRVLYSESRSFCTFAACGLRVIAEALEIDFNPIYASELDIDDSLKGQQRVLHIAGLLKAKNYINLPGGEGMYDAKSFSAKGIDLWFVKPRLPEYKVFGGRNGALGLSILDTIAFCGLEETSRFVLTSKDMVKAEAV